MIEEKINMKEKEEIFKSKIKEIFIEYIKINKQNQKKIIIFRIKKE